MCRAVASFVLFLALGGRVLASWLPEERLTFRPDTADNTTPNYARCIASDRAGNVHVVWYGRWGQKSQVWYKRLDALSGRWSENTVISHEPQGAISPCLAVDDSGNVHVAWQVATAQADTVLRYRCRNVTSGIWDSVETVARGTYVRAPSLAARQDVVALVWSQQWLPQYQGVFLALRTRGGWSQPEMVSDSFSRDQGTASVGVGAGTISVLWKNGTADMIMFRQREATGWARPETVFRGSSAGPCLWIEPKGTAHSIWTASISGRDRYVYRQRQEGIWRDAVMLPETYPMQEPVSLGVEQSGQIHLVWVAKDTVYYATAESSGRRWSVPLAIGYGPYRRGNPSLHVKPDGDLQVAWTDNRHNPYPYPDIYCRRYGWLRDICVQRIVSPLGIIDSGMAVVPAVWIANRGDSAETQVRVDFRLGDSGQQKVVTSIPPGDSAFVQFDTCRLLSLGRIALCCSTALTGDAVPANNVSRDSIFVRLRDVALDSILYPRGLLPRDTLRPAVTVRNRGNVATEVRARFTILENGEVVYSGQTTVPILAGAVRRLEFPPWSGRVGVFAAVCSVSCPGDVHPENDTGSTRFELFYRDLGIEDISWPAGQVDSGVFGLPLVQVRNLGNTAERYRLFLAIGADYRDSLEVQSLLPGQTDTLRFAGWTAQKRGLLFAVCSLWCSGDMNLGNNVAARPVFVQVRDVAVESIVSPAGPIAVDSVRPCARLRNQGNTKVSSRCCFLIESDSSGTVYVDSADFYLAPDSVAEVVFSGWQGKPGRYGTMCFSSLGGDMCPENDTLRGAFVVYRPEVRVIRMTAPAAVIDSGWYDCPVVELHNVSPVPLACLCSLYIGPYYAQVETVAGMSPGETRRHRFSEPYYAVQRGWQPVLCSILGFAGTSRMPACQLECSLFVRVRDVSVEGILAPSGNVGRGEIRPQARVRNRGNVTGKPGCWFAVRDSAGELYRDSISLELKPGSDAVAEFRSASFPSGRYSACAWTCMEGDRGRSNDTAEADFRVVRMDAAAERIVQPSGVIRPGKVRPAAVVANLGEYNSDIEVMFWIMDSVPVYSDTVRLLRVGPGKETTALFREWDARLGKYNVQAVTMVAGDEDPGNDSCVAQVRVELPRRWVQLQEVPAGRANQPVRAGGCLVSLRDGLLALKGGNTDECYRYSVNEDSWFALSPLPPSATGRKVKAGAAVCFDGVRLVYVLRGNRTREFLAYDVLTDSWRFLSALPEGTRMLKYGAGLAFLSGDTGRVLFVKGSGTCDVLVYWTKQNQWHARRRLPRGPQDRPARRGTCLVVSAGRVFCLKGGTNEFYEYFPKGDSWVRRADLPAVGSSGLVRKVRDGASLCADQSGCVYAFKGRSNEFWRYSVSTDVWVQLDDFSFPEPVRKAGPGAALAFFSGRVYALRGGSSRELWRYEPETAGKDTTTATEGESGLAAHAGASPNAKWLGTDLFLLPGSAVVYDICGRQVQRTVLRNKSRFSFLPGVYFVRVAQDRHCHKVLLLR